MHGIVDALTALVSEGNALMTDSGTEPAALQEWVTQRGNVLQRLERLEDEWLATDRHAVRGLIEQMLAVDATLIPRLAARLENLGKEILTTRKIREALGSSAPTPHASLFIERAV
jgi:hypothetical protein